MDLVSGESGEMMRGDPHRCCSRPSGHSRACADDFGVREG
jgi:hypothetical protein